MQEYHTNGMFVCYFDTETNGVPEKFTDPPWLLQSWPRIVEIAWKLVYFTPEGKGVFTVEEGCHKVKPSLEMEWSKSAEEIHGITEERARNDGGDLFRVMHAFWGAVDRANIIVAHNLRFDRNVVDAEMIRLGDFTRRWPFIQYCTQMETVSLCRLEAPETISAKHKRG